MAHLFMCVHSVLSVVKHPVLNVEFVSIGWMWTGLTAGEANQDNLEELAGVDRVGDGAVQARPRAQWRLLIRARRCG